MALLNLRVLQVNFSTTVKTKNSYTVVVHVMQKGNAPFRLADRRYRFDCFWLRYVDDTFTTVRQGEINTFHHHLNGQNNYIQFTREVAENDKLPFLNCLVSRDDKSLRTTIYWKPTHTDRLLDESSYNPISHKSTTIRTLHTSCDGLKMTLLVTARIVSNLAPLQILRVGVFLLICWTCTPTGNVPFQRTDTLSTLLMIA